MALDVKMEENRKTLLSDIKKSISKIGYNWNSQIIKYFTGGAYYNNDLSPDFQYENIYLKITWNNISNKTITRRIPLKVLFYNNYSDYYTFDEGKITEHPGRMNSRITSYDFN